MTHRDEMSLPLERHFIPGPLGYEPGAPSPAPGPSAYRTRSYSGLDSAEAKSWGEANGLGGRPAFSHNLATVFPPELYATHPEYFPLVAGARMRPGPGRVNWNPDLGRPDVAEHAANAALTYFAANPTADSFALGTNDALTFGESPELLALVARAPTAQLMVDGWPLSVGEPRITQEGGTGAVTSAATNNLQPTTNNRVGPANAWFRGRPDYANLVFTFMNRVAERVAPLHPDKYLGALAYYWSENAPDFPVHPNVMPFLTADRSQGYDAAFRAEEAALQARWAKALGAAPAVATGGPGAAVSRERGMRSGALRQSVAVPQSDPPSPADAGHRALGEAREHRDREAITEGRGAVTPRLGLYDYLYGYGFLIPRIHTSLIAPYLRDARRLGFTDYYAEMGPNWGLDGPQPWLVAQLLQDPEANPGDLLDEYYARYFREAARPMRRFFERCEQIWMSQPGSSYWLKHYRNESQAALFPPGVCVELRRLLDNAALRAKSPEVAQRVALVSDAFGLTEQLSRLHVARTALVTWALRSANDAVAGRRLLVDFADTRKAFNAHADELRVRAPLAIHAFDREDYLKHDPVWLAVARLVAAGVGASLLDQESPDVTEIARVLTDPADQSSSGGQGAALSGNQLIRDGGFEGLVVPARRIAGLAYGVDATSSWASRVEPGESLTFSLGRASARSGARGVRVAGALDAAAFQWSPTTDKGTHVASIWVRGRVTVACAVTLTLGWIDEKNQYVGGTRVARLPEGDWPDWVELIVGGEVPTGARWVGVGFRVQNQIDGAWAEFDDVSLIER